MTNFPHCLPQKKAQASPAKAGVNTKYMEKWREDVLSGENHISVNSEVSECQAIYQSLGNSKKVLVTFCCGLKTEDGLPFIDLDLNPWCFKPKVVIKPLNKDLAVEVLCCQKVILSTEGRDPSLSLNKDLNMRPSNKGQDILAKWLDTWPVQAKTCVKFLNDKANRVKQVLQSAIDENKETLLAKKHGAWNGSISYLRLVHCIIDHDLISHAYLNRNAPKTREELDALKSSTRAKSAWELIADKWNDLAYNLTTIVSNCHSDFQKTTDCEYPKVAALLPANYLEVQNWLSGMRAHLLRIIDKWEASGQGDGGQINNPDDPSANWESLKNCSQFLGR